MGFHCNFLDLASYGIPLINGMGFWPTEYIGSQRGN